jgi:hypothetical protein
VIFPKTPIIIATNLNTTENSRTSLGNSMEGPKGIVVFAELFTIVIPYVNVMTRMLSRLKFFKYSVHGISVASGRENNQNYY